MVVSQPGRLSQSATAALAEIVVRKGLYENSEKVKENSEKLSFALLQSKYSILSTIPAFAERPFFNE